MTWRTLLLALALTAGGLARGGDPTDKATSSLTAAEKRFLELTNAERVKQKLPPLRLNPVLCQVARTHAANMAKHQKIAHELDGKNQFQRIKGAGYRYRYAGENLARGDVEVEMIIQGLMASKGHRANLLGEQYTELGVGLATGAKDVIYYTQVFATPKPPETNDPSQ